MSLKIKEIICGISLQRHTANLIMLLLLRHEICYVVSLMISVEILNDKLLTIFGQIPRPSGVMLEVE